MITTDISEEQHNSPTPLGLSAFPQPASTTCTVRWTGGESADAVAIELSDMQGRVVWQGGTVAGSANSPFR